MKNRLNITFSVLMFLFSLFVIVGSFMAQEVVDNGLVEAFHCTQDSKHESTFSYKIVLKNGNEYHNRLNIPCSELAGIKKGDLVEVQAKGKQLNNIKFNDELIFDQNRVELRRSGIIFIFYILLIASAIDIGYRFYFNGSNGRGH